MTNNGMVMAYIRGVCSRLPDNKVIIAYFMEVPKTELANKFKNDPKFMKIFGHFIDVKSSDELENVSLKEITEVIVTSYGNLISTVNIEILIKKFKDVYTDIFVKNAYANIFSSGNNKAIWYASALSVLAVLQEVYFVKGD